MQRIVMLSLALVAFSGCLTEDEPEVDANGIPIGEVGDLVESVFDLSVVPAVHLGHGLYEPTIDVSAEGTIYISAHSTGIGVLPAPAYVSTDDGATWQTLPLAGPVATPNQIQGANPLLSDEIFIVAGDDGTAWGVDINLHDFIISGWCDDGATNCYYNPAAYDPVQTVMQATDCAPVPLKDRPWVAHADGWLIIVNNPGGGPMQIASMQVPTTLPVDVGPALSGIEWNLCASSGGFIPGIPDIRDDGFFAVPQEDDGAYKVVVGNITDILSPREVHVFDNSHIAPAESDSTPSQIGVYGQAVFDADGTLFVGAMNNSAGSAGPGAGGIHLAVSADSAETFTEATFRFDQPVSSFYLDGNKNGTGALLNWGQIDGANTDWYMGHIVPGANGIPALTNVMLAVDDGPEASRHVQGAALGPDGRAYMVMSEVSGNDDQAMAAAAGSTPMIVVVQTDGPTL